LDTPAGIDRRDFEGELGGRMMGVLVVQAPDGSLGYLRAFAGMVEGSRERKGFVPPVHEVESFEGIWAEGSPKITELDDRIATLDAGNPLRHRLEDERRLVSHEIHEALYETYRLRNARGEERRLRELFAPRNPPGGAGDCAAPKLLSYAYAHELRPLALAEFWWGAPPRAGGRQHGVYYPACRGRCGKILPFMLEGLECEPPPDFGIKAVPDDAPTLVHEDEAIIVVDKPAGLLSVRGRGPKRQDSVEARLQARHCPDDETWPRLVHRLDLATSGLLVAAKGREAYVALQRQFSSREVQKRYIAILERRVGSPEGHIDFPIGRDLEDRPRQKYDPERGKPARTRWERLEDIGAHSRIALFPETGRTHQLRLHAAHERGLGIPIRGDWIYGFGGERLCLHAERLAFRHPQTGLELSFEAPCPF
jgi:tRNA pseudouridine32 synthase/23S rRNA pseudouridine746 synthase